MSTIPLPPIHSTDLRKRVFTHVSVFRVPTDASVHELNQIENVDNDRLAFLGRAAVDYVLPVSEDATIDSALASYAHSFDIVKLLQKAWLPPQTTQYQATQLMEAYIGALLLESEVDAMTFVRALVSDMVGGQVSSDAGTVGVDISEAPPANDVSTGALHDRAARHGIVLSWDDHPRGPKHDQVWTSDISLKQGKTGRAWPCAARGIAKSKKMARADGAAKVLRQWDSLVGL